MNYRITQALEEDLPAILSLQKEAFRIVANAIGTEDIPPLTQTIEEVREDANNYTVLKYEADGRIAGTVRAKMLDNGNCRIARLAVAPQYHNMGIGRKLMAEVERRFPDCKSFELFTSIEIPNSRHLYRSLGYEVERIGPGDGVTVIYFRKPNRKPKRSGEIKKAAGIGGAESTISLATEKDLPEILAMQRRAFSVSAAVLGNMDVPPLRQTLEELREEARAYTVLKYVTDGKTEGTIRGKILETGNCYVAKLAVDPACHNRGIGRRLLAALEQRFAGCRGFELITSLDTPNTVYLYKSAGYEVARISIDDVGVTLLHFVKPNRQPKR